jgi:protein SCO1/2
LKIDDAISFRLNVTQRDSWIDRIRKIDVGQVHLPVRTSQVRPVPEADARPRLREGDSLPAFRLVDQDGKEITAGTFLGHQLVLTFIFTRCSLPKFCPLMSQNFAKLQSAIAAESGATAQTKLLSISFDPEFDTPQILKEYAEHEHADPGVWTFATGDKREIETLTRSFSVLVQPEGGTISHGLATALIGKGGKVVKIWRGNGWTPAEVLAEIRTGE